MTSSTFRNSIEGRVPAGAIAVVSMLVLPSCGGGSGGPVAPAPDEPTDSPQPSMGQWTAKASLGAVARDRAVSLSIGDRGYVGLGQGTVPGTYRDFWEYDPATDAWTQKADFGGEPRHSAAGFSIGDRGYVGTGSASDETGDEKVVRDFWEYDPAANTWTRIADFGGLPRFGAVGFSIGEKGYVGTGKKSRTGGHLSDFWEYDPSADTWTRTSDVPGPPRQHGVAFAIGNRGYLGLGWSSGYDHAFEDFYEYDPSTDSWTRIADLGGFGRVWAAGFSAGGRGYVGTGNRGRPRPQSGPDKLRDLWAYDPQTDTWTRMADFRGLGRHAAVGFAVGDRGYIGTGWDGSQHRQDLWEFTPPEE